MNSADVIRTLKGIGRKIVAVIEDCWYSQRRMAALRTGPDHYCGQPDAAPDTYAEFMFRTSGALMHEPTARQRLRGALTPR